MSIGCNNKDCCKHGKCVRAEKHDPEIVSGPGVSNRCRVCGDFNVFGMSITVSSLVDGWELRKLKS